MATPEPPSLAQSLVDAAAPGAFPGTAHERAREVAAAVLEALVAAVPQGRNRKIRVEYLAELAAEIREGG